MADKKNCHTCSHLDYEHGDYESQTQSGWVCGKRDPVTMAAENKLIKDMQRDAYRNQYKRCWEPKPVKIEGVRPPLFDKDPTNIQY